MDTVIKVIKNEKGLLVFVCLHFLIHPYLCIWDYLIKQFWSIITNHMLLVLVLREGEIFERFFTLFCVIFAGIEIDFFYSMIKNRVLNCACACVLSFQIPSNEYSFILGFAQLSAFILLGSISVLLHFRSFIVDAVNHPLPFYHV